MASLYNPTLTYKPITDLHGTHGGGRGNHRHHDEDRSANNPNATANKPVVHGFPYGISIGIL